MRLLAASTLLIVAVAASFVYLRNGEPAWFQRMRYPLEYEQIVRGHARNYQLDPALLAAVIYQESKFRADAKSDAGAIGLMQLQPETAKGIAIRTGGSRFQTSDLYNPEINVRYGSWYLRHLLDKYGDEKTALAAYNAGQRNVDEWRAEGKGIQFSETRAYVDRVEDLKKVYAPRLRPLVRVEQALALGLRRAEWFSLRAALEPARGARLASSGALASAVGEVGGSRRGHHVQCARRAYVASRASSDSSRAASCSPRPAGLASAASRNGVEYVVSAADRWAP